LYCCLVDGLWNVHLRGLLDSEGWLAITNEYLNRSPLCIGSLS